MARIVLRASLVLLILGLGFTAGWGQQPPPQRQQQPATQSPSDTRIAAPAAAIPALSTEKTKGEKSTAGSGEPMTSSEPAGTSLTGAEVYTLSTMGQSHNYFYPVFQVAESGDTNGNNQIGVKKFESVSTVSGAFTLNHVWSRYNFSANYEGSGFIYNRDTSQSTSAHVFSLSQTIQGVRSSFLLTDTVSYLPEAAFGYARFSSFGGFGVGGLSTTNVSNLSGVYLPNQSILTGYSTRVSNSIVGEYDYSVSPLSSWTFTGAYTLLRFPDTSLIDSNAGILSVGYNHSLTPRDTLAVQYTGSIYRYDLSSDDFSNHILAFVYGHRISRLLSLSLGGGPQVNILGILNSAAPYDTHVSWYATASLAYRLQRTALTLYYTHYTSGGAGVFLGAKTDNLGLTIARQLTRMWSGSIHLGYSRNTDLQTTATSPTFNTWYASANLQRPLGQYMNVFLSYNLQQQKSNGSYCLGGGCGTFYTRNYFSLGFNWHPRATELGGVN